MARKRTNIEIEDTYLRIVMDRYSLRTMTEAVELALRHLAGQPMTRESPPPDDFEVAWNSLAQRKMR